MYVKTDKLSIKNFYKIITKKKNTHSKINNINF